MNITLTSLEALILKATHESLPCPDAAALEAFCAIMKDSAEGPMLAAQTLAARIHAPNAREALLALTMLDRCMRRCDAAFHAEVGKFRFLNEMIKLVSPKYFADRTAPEVRQRVLQLLHAWSIEYPKETKFKVAYDMLKNQGVVKETPPPLPPEDTAPLRSRAKNAIFEDEEKSKLLQKLLQSKKPEDLQHANRLIKTMVREEERRTEVSSRRAAETGAARAAAGLLREMVARAHLASPDERQLIDELRAGCERLRGELQRLACHPDATDDDLNEILHASDVLDEVFEEYNAFIAGKKDTPEQTAENQTSNTQMNSDSLLDFAGAKPDDTQTSSERKTSVIDELGDIFSTAEEAKIAEPLKPFALLASGDAEQVNEKSSTKKEGWNELDSLGEQLLKQALPEKTNRTDNFSKTHKKIPMNALEKSPKLENQTNNGAILDLDFFTKPAEVKQTCSSPIESKPFSPTDDVMVDISTEEAPQNKLNHNATSSDPLDRILDLSSVSIDNVTSNSETRVDNKNSVIEKKDSKKGEVKPLTDINVTLESVRPSKVSPMTVFEEEEGVTVVLHFCKDKPRPDVNIIVISTTSKCKSPIEDYKFQAVVPKGCKAKLLNPSGTSLPAYNPFLPPPALTQVLAVARPPTHSTVGLKFVITYTTDGDCVSEMGEVKQLPLDDI